MTTPSLFGDDPVVYVDALFGWVPAEDPHARRVGARNNDTWCHMWSENDPESKALHALARKIGMKREWFQDAGRRLPHYDLTPGRRVAAIKAGAAEASREKLVECLRANRERQKSLVKGTPC